MFPSFFPLPLATFGGLPRLARLLYRQSLLPRRPHRPATRHVFMSLDTYTAFASKTVHEAPRWWIGVWRRHGPLHSLLSSLTYSLFVSITCSLTLTHSFPLLHSFSITGPLSIIFSPSLSASITCSLTLTLSFSLPRSQSLSHVLSHTHSFSLPRSVSITCSLSHSFSPLSLCLTHIDVLYLSITHCQSFPAVLHSDTITQPLTLKLTLMVPCRYFLKIIRSFHMSNFLCFPHPWYKNQRGIDFLCIMLFMSTPLILSKFHTMP